MRIGNCYLNEYELIALECRKTQSDHTILVAYMRNGSEVRCGIFEEDLAHKILDQIEQLMLDLRIYEIDGENHG